MEKSEIIMFFKLSIHLRTVLASDGLSYSRSVFQNNNSWWRNPVHRKKNGKPQILWAAQINRKRQL